jgi:hypothetical protein
VPIPGTAVCVGVASAHRQFISPILEGGMNKLKLNLDQLAVESFDTSRPAKAKGTVFGEQCTCWTQCTCPGCPTCENYATCDATCPNTCAYTCDDASCAGSCNCGSANCESNYCGTAYDVTCRGIGTCGIYPCADIP